MNFTGGLVSHPWGIPLPPIPVYWQVAIEHDWVINDSEKLEIYMDIRHFCTTKIAVRTKRSEIIIEAHHKIIGEYGNAVGGFVRSYNLSAHQYSDDVTTCLSPDGAVLKITVPKLNKHIKEKYLVIPSETNIEVKHE